MRWFLVGLMLMLMVAACGRRPGAAPVPRATPALTLPQPRVAATATPTPVPSATPTRAYTPSPRAPLSLWFVTPTPAVLARWQEHERALARALLPWLPVEQVRCEWVVFAQEPQALYVWAVCEGDERQVGPSGVSMPVVLNLNAEGRVLDVWLPQPGRHYGPSIRTAFPTQTHRQVLRAPVWLDVAPLRAHLQQRFTQPDLPPLVILAATPKP